MIIVSVLLLSLMIGTTVASTFFYKQLVTTGTLELTGGVQIIDMTITQVNASHVCVSIDANVTIAGSYRITLTANGYETFIDGNFDQGIYKPIANFTAPYSTLYRVEITELP